MLESILIVIGVYSAGKALETAVFFYLERGGDPAERPQEAQPSENSTSASAPVAQ